MSDKDGQRFGRYRLVERLGAGGMAAVYRAVLEGPQGFVRTLAIKRVLPELVRTPSFVKMLGDEARLSALLSHPCIVQVYELGDIDGEPYIAMELVDGWDLFRLLKSCQLSGRRVPVGVAAFIAAELASALAYAHALTDAQGRPLELIHRDVSPSNVMITRRGAVKLLDFGIAKALSQVANEHTRTGVMKGKLGYLSPEQADGEPIDRRADLFALGVVLHEMLTGRRLFSAGDDLRTLKLIREGRVAPPSLQREGLDPELDRVTLRLLARLPAERFQRGEEVVEALRGVAHRAGGDAEALRAFVEELAPALTPVASDPRGLETVSDGRLARRTAPLAVAQRTPRWVLAAAVVVVASLATAGLLLGRRAVSERAVAAPALPDAATAAQAQAGPAPAPPPSPVAAAANAAPAASGSARPAPEPPAAHPVTAPTKKVRKKRAAPAASPVPFTRW